MKRLGSSDSLGALISLCPVSEEHSPRGNHMYSLEYQSMLESLEKEGCMEESGHIPEKKRRLSVDQVKALEKYFEVENKLEPERKVKLAQELGLQPRQVAVWFQNRRARWKTRQLERDYTTLKSNFDSLKQNYESLQHDKDSLLKKIKELKSKLKEENIETDICLNRETKMLDASNNPKSIEPIIPPPSLSGGSNDVQLLDNQKRVADFKDGPSESDSSAILNEGNNNSPNASNSSCGGGSIQNEQQLLSSSSPSSINCFNFTLSKSEGLASVHNHNNNNVYHPEYVKLEEHDFFSGEEACNIFSDEAAPTLHWYCSDQWT